MSLTRSIMTGLASFVATALAILAHGAWIAPAPFA